MENKKDKRTMTLEERFKYVNEQKKKKFNSTNNKEEWDEDHALDMVMNDMVKDFTEEDIKNLNE
jgi:hypothetical protein